MGYTITPPVIRGVELAASTVTITAGAPSYTIPNDRRNIQPFTLQNNATITLPLSTAVVATGQVYSLIVELTQDGSGSKAVTWALQGSDTLNWLASTTAHAINTTANKRSRVQFIYVGGRTAIDASVIWVDG